MSARDNAAEAAEWCRERDEFGDTNFQRALRWAESVSMDRGRTAITSSEMRAELHTRNAYTSAIMRWLMMADCSLCGLITTSYVSELDGVRDDPCDEDRAWFASLFRGFGETPDCRDHIEARAEWRARVESLKGASDAS